MQIHRKSLYLARVTLDSFFVIGSFIIAQTSYKIPTPLDAINWEFMILSLLLITWIFSGKSLGLYDEFRSRDFSFELIALIKNIFIQAIAYIILVFIIREYSVISRLVIVYYSGLLLIFLSLEKYLFRKFLNLYRSKGRNLRSLLIVGAGEVGQKFHKSITDNPHFGYKFVGFLDDQLVTSMNGKYLGSIDKLHSILSDRHIDDIIIALPNYATSRLRDVVATCERHTTRIRIIPDYFDFVTSRYNVAMFGDFPIISLREDRLNEFHWRLLKRGFDFAFTSFLFVFVFSWVFPLIAISIKTTSKGPVFFKQERWGRYNKKFITYKFRSMCTESKDTDSSGKYIQASKDDPRITKIGKFLRKTNLDELPQFMNVILGDMSIVGPRPHPIPLNIESRDKVHHYMIRHLVKPGITGWAQVNGFRGETKENGLMQERINHDIWYIENWTFLLDIQIIFLTVWKMLKGDPNAY